MTTENKAIDDLLKPRYKVIADYPLSVHAIGEVLVPYIGSANMCVVEGGFFISDLSKYPHLFKKLEWWEERQESEMPEYVKHEEMIVKVDSYVMGIGFNFYYGESSGYGKRAFTKDTLPATLSEYLNYQKQKQ